MFGFGASKKKAGKADESFGLPGLSFGKAEKTLGQASDALKNTGNKVEDFLFGHPKNKNNENVISVGVPSLGISIGTGKLTGNGPTISGTLNKVGGDLNRAEGALEKTGEDTLNYLFGKNKNKAGKANVDVPSIGVSLTNGKQTGVDLTGTMNEIGGSLNKAESALEKTGEDTLEYLFGKNKNKAGKANVGLPSLDISLGIGGKTGGKSSLTGSLNEIGGDLNKAEGALEKTAGETIDYLFGKNKKKNDINLASPALNGMSIDSTSLPNLLDVEKNINKNINEASSDLKQTGKKVVDYILGGKNDTKSIELSIGGKKNNSPIEGIVVLDGKIESTALPNLSVSITNLSSEKKAGNETSSKKPHSREGLDKTDEKILVLNSGDNNSKNPAISFSSTYSTVSNPISNAIPIVNNVSYLEKSIGSPKNEEKGKSTHATNSFAFAETVSPNFAYSSKESFVPSDLPEDNSTPMNKVEIFTETNSSFSIESEASTVHESTDSFVGTKDKTHPLNSLEESANGLFGVSEIPTNLSTKSEDTLKKVEDILQGSGNITTLPSTNIGHNLGKWRDKISGRANTTSSKSHGFVYSNNVSEENSSTEDNGNSFSVSVVEVSEKSPTPTEQNPFFLIPNSVKIVAPSELPPSDLDKPTSGKAPFIPILPPPMEPTMRTILTTSSSKTSEASVPSTTPTPTGSLTPLEYGAIGVGVVFIFALIAYIYQKYQQYRTSSAGGSYSPKTQHRNDAGRRRSTRSNNSDGSQSLIDETTMKDANGNKINSENSVAAYASETKMAEEVVEIPMTKTVFNGLQKSSAKYNEAALVAPEKCEESIEIISEKQKSTIDKPPRKTKTPNNSPQKFTSDKTSASQLNEDSLKTVSQAIGGLLTKEIPNEKEIQKSLSNLQAAGEESKGDDVERGISLLSKLADPISSNETPDTAIKDKSNIPKSSDIVVLHSSIEREVDAGSEYYSADENSESKNSPPLSPSFETQFKKLNGRNLRAEDVYNIEIVSEDGRRRSIEEDIAESISVKESINPFNKTSAIPTSETGDNYTNTPLKSGENIQFPEKLVDIGNDDTKHDPMRSININDVTPEVMHAQILKYQKQEAEPIIDEILRTHPDLTKIQSEGSAFVNIKESKVRCSDDLASDSIKHEPVGDKKKVQMVEESIIPLETTSEKQWNEFENINTLKLDENTEFSTTIPNNSSDSKFGEKMHNTEKNCLIDEACLSANILEFTHSNQPQIHEDNSKVFANADPQSIYNLSEARTGFNYPNEESLIANNKNEDKIKNHPASSSNFTFCEDCGGIQSEDLIVDESKGLESIKNEEKIVGQNHTKWYVPNDDNESRNGEKNSIDGLYIDLEENNSEKRFINDFIEPTCDNNKNKSSNHGHISNVSYAYIEVNANEGWPEHLPKNIHSVSGVGLIKTAEEESSSFQVLKEEESEIVPSCTDAIRNTNFGECERINISPGNSSDSSVGVNQKPIPKFIIPNMDGRLSKKRTSRRRQIKSLDSGVHHYYGEYLNLVEFPEERLEEETRNTEEVIEDIITIKPDGTITEEKIIIHNSK